MHVVQTGHAPASAGPYSQAIRSGDLLFLAGQGPFAPNGDRVGETFEEQVRRTMENLRAVAEAGGASLDDAVRMGAYLKSLDDFAEFNRLMAEYLSPPYPARTTLQVDLRGFDVEIDMVLEIRPPADPTIAGSA